MAERISDTKPEGNERDGYKLELVGLAADERPNMAVQVLDADNNVLHAQPVQADGSFAIPPTSSSARAASRSAPPTARAAFAATPRSATAPSEFAAQLKDGTLALAEGTWSRFRFQWVCVSGKVQACWRRPWWYDSVITAATTVKSAARDVRRAACPPISHAAASDAASSATRRR